MKKYKTHYLQHKNFIYWEGKIPDLDVIVVPGAKYMYISSENGLPNGGPETTIQYPGLINGESATEWVKKGITKANFKNGELYTVGLFIDMDYQQEFAEDMNGNWNFPDEYSMTFEEYIWVFELWSGIDLNGDSEISGPFGWEPDIFYDVNNFAFETLGANFKWDKIDFNELNEESIDAIKWDKVDFKKATKASSFSIDIVDWTELNTSKAAKKAYNSINWFVQSISSEVAAQLDYSKMDMNKFDVTSLIDINDLPFEKLGNNYKKLNWDQVDFSALEEDSIDAIEWDKVNFKKASQSSTFTLDIVDWSELNSSKAAKKAYKTIDWATASISSDVAQQLDYSKINFKKFDPSNLSDINDLAFETLGKNYKNLKWDKLDFSSLNEESIDAIEWDKVNFKKASQSSSFTLDIVDWSDVNSSKAGKKAYKVLGIPVVADSDPNSLSTFGDDQLDFSKVNFKNFNPSNLSDINSIPFGSLGNNYKKLKWDQIDFSALEQDSIDAIEWDKVNFKKASQSSTFTLDTVDWSELNASKAAKKAYKSINWKDEDLIAGASQATISSLDKGMIAKYGKVKSSKLYFNDEPEPIGSLELLAGTEKNDKIKSSGGQATFSGDGNDILTGLKISSFNGIYSPTLMAGGSGSDKYIVKKGGFSIIFEQSNQGNDFVDLNAIKLKNDPFFISVDEVGDVDQLWVIGDNSTTAVVSSNIENFKFGGKKFSAEALQNKLLSLGSVDSFTFSFLDLQNYVDLDLSAAGITSAVDSFQSLVDSAIYNSSLI